MSLVLHFTDLGIQNLPEVGGKNASLGEMINQLASLGIKVPRGFATTSDAFQQFLAENNLKTEIYGILDRINLDNIESLQENSKLIREKIISARIPTALQQAVEQAYHDLKLDDKQTVAVRSSATAEDLPEASFAGQQETYLNVAGIDNILAAIKSVFASLYTDRAISYRINHGFRHDEVSISAGIQRMIRSDIASSGVMFTVDTESGFEDVIFLTASYGLGEMVVQGAVNPDEFYVHKPTLIQNKKAIIGRNLGSKLQKMTYNNSGNHHKETLQTVNVPEAEQIQYCLTDDEILKLAKHALIIEKHYGKPMDIEWAKDGIDKELYIIQARPETVTRKKSQQCIERYCLSAHSHKPVITGRSIGQKVGQGIVRYIQNPSEMDKLQNGEILLADMTDPDWEPIMKRASAIVTNRGGRTCHAAIIAREMGIPAVVGCGNATDILTDGENYTVSCAEGETGYVYPGIINYEVEKTEIGDLPKLPMRFCMNLANPEQAFSFQYLPNDGIGLARLEFIINNMIGVHPNALLDQSELTQDVIDMINKKTAAYESPKEFYIEKLAEGISTIAAAFYPKPIIVRFSDFKSNEYAHLLGGELFEPKEENPMIGYRGASRYTSGYFKTCYLLECEAIRRVREEKGLINTHVMFPFVRTVDEAQQLIEITKQAGLKRGDNDLKFYMMCEIPSNAILAEEFLAYFDGFSIGSNDLTQLTLGLDRDSALVADLFDERNLAVKKLLKDIIDTCKKLNKYVGICGQGPSDHLDLAKWLMNEGIDSLSLTPDSIVQTWQALAKEA